MWDLPGGINYPSYLRSLGSQVQSPVNGKRETSLPLLRRVERKTWATHEPHLHAWQDHGMDPPGGNVKAHARQGGDPRQPA